MNQHGSALVAAAEGAWEAIQHLHPEVPDVVIRLGVSTGSALGHFAEHRLSLRETGEGAHEVMLSAAALRGGGTGAFCTLLHEAVHAACSALGIKDTSRQGRYHNRRFQKCAEQLGLACSFHSSTYGLAFTELTPETEACYAVGVAHLDRAIFFYEKAVAQEDPGPEKGKTPAAKALCQCDRKIPASLLNTGPLTCGLCESEFTTQDEEN